MEKHMKNFIAGVVVTSSVLLVGFQERKVTPKFTYLFQTLQSNGQPVADLLNRADPLRVSKEVTRELNTSAASHGGRLIEFNVVRHFGFVWEIPNNRQ